MVLDSSVGFHHKIRSYSVLEKPLFFQRVLRVGMEEGQLCGSLSGGVFVIVISIG